MTKERAEAIASIFSENYELAKNLGADNGKVALAAAIVYTLDDIMRSDPEDPANVISSKLKKIEKILED